MLLTLWYQMRAKVTLSNKSALFSNGRLRPSRVLPVACMVGERLEMSGGRVVCTPCRNILSTNQSLAKRCPTKGI